jgi:hypothetical protein
MPWNLAFKVLIASKFGGNEIPDRSFVNAIYTHDLERLILHAGLLPALREKQQDDVGFATNWEIVKNWSEGSRYRAIADGEARSLIDALSNSNIGIHMDTDTPVTGGEEGLQKIVQALELNGVAVQGAYLIRLGSADGFPETDFRIVTDGDPRDVIYKFVRLRRDGLIPTLADHVRVSPIRPNHVEASRVMDYAARIGTPTVVIDGVYWDGLFIEDAVVVKWLSPAHAAA